MTIQSTLIKVFGAFVRPGIRSSITSCIISGLTRLISPRKDVALKNLGIAFPDKDLAWKKRMLAGIYDHLALSLTEYLCLVHEPERIHEWILNVQGEEILKRFVQERKGAVILTGHIGNWELLGAWLSMSGYPLTAVVRDPNDPGVASVIRDYRCRTGLKTFSKGNLLTGAVRAARSGNFVGLLADQEGGRKGLRIPFMGVQCSTVTGPAAVSIMAEVPIIPIYSYRVRPFAHKICIGEPLETINPEEDRKKRIYSITGQCNIELEKMIFANPEQWLWLHRRWR